MQAIQKTEMLLIMAMGLFSLHSEALTRIQKPCIDHVCSPGDFKLADGNDLAALYVDNNDFPGVLRAARDLQTDIARVTKRTPKLTSDKDTLRKNTLLIGTIGKSPLIDQLIKDGTIDVSPIKGKWESYLIQTVQHPLPDVDSALVIAGSDKRGVIYGIYTISEQIGVSPWTWWADVPVRHQDTLSVKAGRLVQGPPAVKYRGIFLNDEAPALSGWVHEKFGDFNHEFYTKVFELLLRLKGNFLWPAMWNNSFNTDDLLNPKLADEYGIVMSTSHHEPMMRAWKEWGRAGHERGSWDYSKNPQALGQFWTEGLKRTRDYEKVITLGMRGDGDEPMSEQDDIALLEKIVTDQRKIIADIIDPDVTRVPQVWALYKEVQGYYERGMRVPDDVILLWCDDNWGNIRRLPTAEERKRSGGAGVYYHFDYVGGPRSYRWINTNPIPKIWEQMNLAYHYDANQIWVVNVGDLKPMEFPMDFFLTLAWDPQAWPMEKLPEYTRLWAQRQFGVEYADSIAEIISKYTKFNSRRKPELLEPDTYSLIHYREAERVLADFQAITTEAEEIYNRMPDDAKDAFFQLVLHPAKASAIVNELYITAGKNRLYAAQKRAATNDLAQRVRDLFKADAELTNQYHQIAGGKWNHMMDQTHIGYTSWNNPPKNIMPEVKEINPPAEADMGVAVEGSAETWPQESNEAALPEFSIFTQEKYYIDVFNKGQQPFVFTAESSDPWILLSDTKGTIEKEQRIWVHIDWDKAPEGMGAGSVTISGTDKKVTVNIQTFNPPTPARDRLDGFVESNGYVSIEPEHYTKMTDTETACWEKIPDYGRTLSAMSIFPTTADSVQPPQNSPCLEYKMYVFHAGQAEVHAVFAPTLNFVPGRGLRCGISFDDQSIQILTLVPEGYTAENGNRDWEQSVRDNARTVKSTHTIAEKGYHTLKVWMVDPGVVLQKLIVNTGGLKPSYLGPPESFFNRKKPQNSSGMSQGAFYTGRYRNLFAEVGHDPEEVTAKLNTAFEQLFHGNPHTQAVYFPSGSNENGPLAYICDIDHNDVRSEGMSYAMMIAVQMDKKAEFDAVWNWSKTYMYRNEPDHPAHGYFSWSLTTDGKPNDELPAPDGEEYFVTALYFAAARWGNGEGIYNYRAEADHILTDLVHRKPITGPTVTGTRTGVNLFNEEHKMIHFSSDIKAIRKKLTDPSYHLPAFYELWALWGPVKDRMYWTQAASVSRDFFEHAAHPVTALSPEYAHFDGTPWASEWNSQSVHFQFDAWRTAMNWSFDWTWWAKDPRAIERSNRLQAFFESKGMDDYGVHYTLDGNPLNKEHSTGLVAMNAAASLAATHPRSKNFVQALWKAPVPSGQFRYYEGMLYMLAMLHCSGNYRIWTPE